MRADSGDVIGLAKDLVFALSKRKPQADESRDCVSDALVPVLRLCGGEDGGRQRM